MDFLDKKIEQTLSSLDGIERAEAPDGLFEKTMQLKAWRDAAVKKAKLVPARTVWAIAASLAFLAALNVAFWLSSPQNGSSTEGGSKASSAIAELYINRIEI